MSMTGHSSRESIRAGEAVLRRVPWTQRRLWSMCFALLAFEIGVFLVSFPWMDYWTLNHFPTYFPTIEAVWDDPYFKGGVSGLGVINLYVAALQFGSALKRSKSQ